MITISGSSEIGWRAHTQAARKRVSPELGNATPAIVGADALVDEAAAKLAPGAFSVPGQSCVSVQRIYVQQHSIEALSDWGFDRARIAALEERGAIGVARAVA